MKFKKIEFWIATLITLVLTAILVYQHIENPYYSHLRNNQPDHPDLAYDLISISVSMLLLYASFLFLNFFVFGRLMKQKKYDLIVVSTILCPILLASGLMAANYRTYLVPGREIIPGTTFFILCVLAYIIIKKIIAYYLGQLKIIGPLKSKIIKESLLALTIWAFILLLLLIENGGLRFTLLSFWAFMVPCGYILFMLNTYWLIPEYEKKQQGLPAFILKAAYVSFILSIPFSIPSANGNINIFLRFWLGELIVVTPLAWYLYEKNKAQIHQLLNLKTELGRTTADLQFLRSQINPHFLFNALNTLYGTALQENSDRTAQGIQKLGDMMRFMLQENVQDKIALEKEVEYLHNYIELQQLRTQVSDNILIETRLQDAECPHQIAPMLLIPFVENAFKHGISLKEKSWIKIVLNCDEQNLYFDVYNSLHPKKESDPEKEHTGIGLGNVQQRLSLLYPEKHELSIRQTAQEFIVHLTIALDPVKQENEKEVVYMAQA